MPSDDNGAVILIEASVAARFRNRSEEETARALDRARRLIETPAGGRVWLPSPGPGHAGSMIVEDPSRVFSMLHELRTELRADPGQVAIVLRAGIGRGDRTEGTRLANDGLRSIQKKRRRLTMAVTRNPEANVVLAALCRTLDSLLSGWTDAQWQAIQRRDGGRTLQQIGEELGIAYQNVSKRLIAAQYSLYGDVLEASELVFSRATHPSG